MYYRVQNLATGFYPQPYEFSLYHPSPFLYLYFFLFASSNLRLGLPSCRFPSGFASEILYAILFNMRASFPAHLTFLDFSIVIIGEEYKL
jgi:hypothetical protein